MEYLQYTMKPKSFEYESISKWIESIIESSDELKSEHEKACDRLITNFTDKILFYTNDKSLHNKFDGILRKKLIKKFMCKKKKTNNL